MNDAGHGIQINISTAPIANSEREGAGMRYVLGYISGEFSKNVTTENLYVKIWFQRGLDMAWENVVYRLNNGRKVFKQKIQRSLNQPQGLLVSTFYVELYGWVSPDPLDVDLEADFELTAFELSIKEIPIGKFGAEVLGLEIDDEPPDPPVIPDFEMLLDIIGEVQANQARAIWYTTHAATTRVTYGLSPLAMNYEVEDLTFTKFHDIILDGLSVNQLYYAQFFSISQITGEEIQSEIKSFFTGNELLIINILGNPIVTLESKQKLELIADNVFGSTESLLQLEPDGLGEVLAIGGDFSTHSKTEFSGVNIIGNDYDTNVT